VRLHSSYKLSSWEDQPLRFGSKQYDMQHKTCVSATSALTSAGVTLSADLTSVRYVPEFFRAESMNVGSANCKPAGDAETTDCEVPWSGFVIEKRLRENIVGQEMCEVA